MKPKYKNPDATCSFCDRDNETVKGLVSSPYTGATICSDCANLTGMIFIRRSEIEKIAEEMSDKRRADGSYVSGGDDCDCPSCWASRLLHNDPVMRAISANHMAIMRKSMVAEEITPQSATIN